METPEEGRVVALRRAAEKAVALTVLSGGDSVDLTISTSLWERVGAPQIGDRIGVTLLSELKHASDYRLACRAALRILENGDNNARTLRDKLRRKGISREIAEEAVEKMVALGYIREGEQARRLAAGYARRNLWGPRRIVSALLAKGYSKTDADAAVREIADAGEIVFASVRATLIARCRARGMEPEKIRATLYRYGFRSEDE